MHHNRKGRFQTEKFKRFKEDLKALQETHFDRLDIDRNSVYMDPVVSYGLDEHLQIIIRRRLMSFEMRLILDSASGHMSGVLYTDNLDQIRFLSMLIIKSDMDTTEIHRHLAHNFQQYNFQESENWRSRRSYEIVFGSAS